MFFRSRVAFQRHPCQTAVPHFSPYSPSYSAYHVVKPEITGTGFLCEICNKEFKTNQSLKVHTQAIHEGVRFNCEFCPHSATTKSNLKVHTQKKHSFPQLGMATQLGLANQFGGMNQFGGSNPFGTTHDM